MECSTEDPPITTNYYYLVMPIYKTKQGWYWGSQDPFESKTKAREVEKAAYANGFKEYKRKRKGKR